MQGEADTEGVEVKSRDIGLNFSTPTKRKHKKNKEATAAAASTPPSSSTSQTQIQTTEVSSISSLKHIFVVAIISIILGIYLGKRY